MKIHFLNLTFVQYKTNGQKLEFNTPLTICLTWNCRNIYWFAEMDGVRKIDSEAGSG